VTRCTRRDFLGTTMGAGAALLVTGRAFAKSRLGPVYAEIERRHDETVAMLQAWVRQPSIAAENRGVEEGCRLTMELLREAGFQQVQRRPTDGQPGIFATLDAGARRTVGVYFMYDVKQADPAEWSSPPWEARIVELPGLGRAVMGRAAVNQKGPQSAFLAALRATRGAGGKPPVNLVLVAEGEEEIGSPHFAQVVHASPVREALAKCVGVFMPEAAQGRDGSVTVSLGAKGIVELELVASGEKWGRGPARDVHSSNRARIDSPAWHLVQALNTLVDAQGDPAIDDYLGAVRPLTAREQAMLDEAAQRLDERTAMQGLGVKRWARDASWRQALEDLAHRPTVNIEGLVGGYTGPGGMTILPHRAAAKIDLRLVPDMTRADAVAKLSAHLERRGFGDIEINVTGGYDPTTTSPDARQVRAAIGVYRASGIDPILWPRRGGSWPGYVFTGPPLKLPAGHFGLGHGLRAHAPDEYFLVESTNARVSGMDGAVRSYVDYLHALA
ncbi:MAG TPA: M20/M25/M40 family metallo-hydrolase, partial [Steroidobacteraceae bacterium]|nr:M20/M25/M40 family metallo-hydrolase [Steroidobacteraceae bacterium]